MYVNEQMFSIRLYFNKGSAKKLSFLKSISYESCPLVSARNSSVKRS